MGKICEITKTLRNYKNILGNYKHLAIKAALVWLRFWFLHFFKIFNKAQTFTSD